MNSITTIIKWEKKNPAQLSVPKRETNTCNSCSKSMRGFNSKALNVNWLLPLINTAFKGYSLPQVGYCVCTAIEIVFLFLAACALVSWITHMYDGHFNRFLWGFIFRCCEWAEPVKFYKMQHYIFGCIRLSNRLFKVSIELGDWVCDRLTKTTQ